MAGTLYITRGYRSDSTALADINRHLETGFRKIRFRIQDFGSDAAEVVERLLFPEHLERPFLLSLPSSTGPRTSCSWITSSQCPLQVRTVARCPLQAYSCQTLFLRPQSVPELAGLFPEGESLQFRCQIHGCPCASMGVVLDIQDIHWVPEMPQQAWEQAVSAQIRFAVPTAQQNDNVLTQSLFQRFPKQTSQVKALLDQWVLSLAELPQQSEAWAQRREAAFAVLLQQSPSIAPRLGEYLFDVHRARLPQQSAPIARFFNPALSEPQKTAVQTLLNAPEIAMLQGSESAGTPVLGETVQQLTAQQKRMLIVSSSARSVNRILESLPKDPAILPIQLSSDAEFAFSSTRAVDTYCHSLAQDAQQKMAEQERQNPRRRQLAAALESLVEDQTRAEEALVAMRALESDVQAAASQLENLNRTPASEFAQELPDQKKNPQYQALEQRLEELNAAMRTADDTEYTRLEKQRREILQQLDGCTAENDTAGERQKEAACQEQQHQLEGLRTQLDGLRAKYDRQDQVYHDSLSAFQSRFFADRGFHESQLIAVARRELATPVTVQRDQHAPLEWERWEAQLTASNAMERTQAQSEYLKACNVVGMTMSDDLEVLQALPDVSSAFDVVFVLDVCQMPIWSLLIPLQLAPKAVLMGDPSHVSQSGALRNPHWFTQFCDLAAEELKIRL